MPVFVYNADDVTTADGCLSVTRWNQVQQITQQQFGQQICVDLKVFPGFTTCPGASGIEGWHQYGPNASDNNFAQTPTDGAYTISPGFWKSGVPFGTGTFLARDLGRWRASVAAMNASGRQVAAHHHLQRVGRGHRDRKLIWLPQSRARRGALRLERRDTVSAYITALNNAPPPG